MAGVKFQHSIVCIDRLVASYNQEAVKWLEQIRKCQELLEELQATGSFGKSRQKLRTAMESKAAVQSMKGGRPKKSMKVVKWKKIDREDYDSRSRDIEIVGTLTKDSDDSPPNETREQNEPRHPALIETYSHVSRDLDPTELAIRSNIGSPYENTEPDEPSPRCLIVRAQALTDRHAMHQRMDSYDTSLTESLLHSTDSFAYEDYNGSISSAGDTNYNESSQIATPSANSSWNEFVSISMPSAYSSIGEDSDREIRHSQTKITALDWFLFFTGISIETLSVVFDLRSSPQKPRYALAGMSCGIVAVLLCGVELICKVITERVLLASQNNILSVFKILLLEIAGFGLAIIQSISSIVQFYYYSRHKDNGLKVYLAGIYFCLCLFLIKFRRS